MEPNDEEIPESPYWTARRRQIDAELDRVVAIANREMDQRITEAVESNPCPF